jgi:hypothetical protein
MGPDALLFIISAESDEGRRTLDEDREEGAGRVLGECYVGRETSICQLLTVNKNYFFDALCEGNAGLNFSIYGFLPRAVTCSAYQRMVS